MTGDVVVTAVLVSVCLFGCVVVCVLRYLARAFEPECSGAYDCPAPTHIHGCFADNPCQHDPTQDEVDTFNDAWFRYQNERSQ